MDVELNPSNKFNEILNYLAGNESIFFKNQTREEADLSEADKLKIGQDLYAKSKTGFLIRFGKHLTQTHLDFFKDCSSNEEENEEIKMILTNLSRFHCSEDNKLKTKNRRYEALKQLIKENSYFSESEMMKRNPLLYEQLIGQYLSEEEKRERDTNHDYDSLVKILLERMDRNMAGDKMKKQLEEEEEEDDTKQEEMETQDEFPQVDKAFKWGEFPGSSSSTRWGEIPSSSQISKIPKKKQTRKDRSLQQEIVTGEERRLLRDEFISVMYQHFLDGKDDYDYTTIDNNDEYDNIDMLEHDEEDKYFDSEEPEEINMDGEENVSSEDELDIYMNALHQHPSVVKLSKDLQQL